MDGIFCAGDRYGESFQPKDLDHICFIKCRIKWRVIFVANEGVEPRVFVRGGTLMLRAPNGGVANDAAGPYWPRGDK